MSLNLSGTVGVVVYHCLFVCQSIHSLITIHIFVCQVSFTFLILGGGGCMFVCDLSFFVGGFLGASFF